MAASKLSSCIAIAAAAAASAASASTVQNRAYADSPFRFPFYSSSSSSSSAPQSEQSSNAKADDKTEPEEPIGAGFNPEALERGAKALREINNSPVSKQVFDLMRKQENTRLAELAAEKAHYEAIQTHIDVERQRKVAEEQWNLMQQHAQAKAQKLRYEDELARKRMQADHEAQRRHNAQLAKMQEESSIRKEQARQATEEQIQAQQRQTEKERAEIERETIRVKAMAEAEGRAHEAKLTEDHNRRMLIEKINGEREKWLAAINTTFSHIEGGLRTLLTDRNKLLMTIGGATALAAGVYTTREGARVTWGYINRILGQPSLIRESSMSKFPLSGMMSRVKNQAFKYGTAAKAAESLKSKKGLENVVLHPSLKRRIDQLARATANTKVHQAPFRNMLFHGPPGTGKTLGLDYAMMTGGDVAPLGAQAVTKIHEIFDWAKKSNKGLLLFIDEADAFLCERNSTYMSESQRRNFLNLNTLPYCIPSLERNRKKRVGVLEMGKTTVVVVAMAVLWVGVCRGWGEEATERMNVKAEEVKQSGGAAMQDAKDKTEAWVDWAYNRAFGYTPNAKEGAQKMMHEVGDAASRATETMNSAASETSKHAVQNAREAANMATGKVGNAKNYASGKVDQVIRMASDKADDARERMAEGIAYGKDKVAEAHDNANQKVDTPDMSSDSRESIAGAMRYEKDRAADAYDGAWQKMNMASDKAYDAKEKIAGSVGHGMDKAANAYDEARQKMKMAADKTDAAKETVSGAMGYARDGAANAYDKSRDKASNMAYDTKERMAGSAQYVRDGAANTYNHAYKQAKEKLNMASQMASDKASDVREGMAGSVEHGKNRMANSYDEVVNEVGEAYASARDTMSNQAKANYEAAKERASQAAGALGAKMRNDGSEL
ncbi:hypothetical protein SLEP1_g7996 [Rubroshorea leprosula]|uniref:AAA+ ATPase domain-containing protein n=1 Tax=Rubroshorea leprosula TaxID=152421 RepID=A0AAV5I859_9ROSI|nr:hypothetical protein SLEP1_g7996 [Rubroshorea leprosula]